MAKRFRRRGVPLRVTLAAAVAILWAVSAHADPLPLPTAFDHPVGIGGYIVGSAGGYDAAGIGGRIVWEILPRRLGLDMYMDALVVDWPNAFRHDHPIGFNVYTPILINPWVRLRPLLGVCVTFSFIDPTEAGAPPSDDVMFGVHGGVGLEAIVYSPFTWFIDAQGIWYVGHDRTATAWSGSISGTLSWTSTFQLSTGFQVHFG